MLRTLLYFGLFLTCQVLYAQDEWDNLKVIEKLELDMDFDGIMDSITLSGFKDWNDPGDYQKVHFGFSKINDLIIKDINPAYQKYYDRTTSNFETTNSLLSKYVYLVKARTSNYVLLFGYTFASTPAILTIIRIDNNQAEIVYNNNFDLINIDLDNDQLVLTGRQFFPEPYKFFQEYEVRTYAPYTIIVVNHTSSVDYSLTEEYNMQNYAGYRGLFYDEDCEVLHKKGEKPKFYFTTYRKYSISSSRRLHKVDLEDKDVAALRIMRNEIFADYGYIFKSEDLASYFNSQNWYKPKSNNVTDQLTEIEKYNIDLILKFERANGG